VEFAPALVLSPGGIGPAFEGFGSVRLQVASPWSVALFGLVPFTSDRVRAKEGSASVSTWIAGAGADLHTHGERFELGLRAGAGAVFTVMHGEAEAPYRSHDQTVVVAALFAGPSLQYHLGGGFRVCARALAGLALPRVAVRFAGREVAHWGRPFGVGTIGLEYAF
jgi:hypothetical protein